MALQDVQEHGFSLRKAAAKWAIGVTTLFKLKADPERSMQHAPFIFTRDEENELIEWVQQCNNRGYSRSSTDIVDGALSLLKLRQGEAAVRPGRSWLEAFRNRHSLSQRKPQSLTKAASCVSKKDIQSWFTRLEEALKQEGLEHLLQDPSRVFSADESFFLLNPSKGKVWAVRGTKNVFEAVKDEKEGLTVMLLVRADGKPCKPYILYPHERIPPSIRESFPYDEARMSGTENGWMTGAAFCVFLRGIAEDALVEGIKMPEEQVLLFVDNHSSHLTFECCELANQLGIVMVPLPPNTTFLTQPCDVSCFKSLKSKWKKEVNSNRSRILHNSISKPQFAGIFMQAFKCLDPQTIRNGFRRCGLYPFDKEALDFSKMYRQEHKFA